MKRRLIQFFESISDKVVESFFSKVADRTATDALNQFMNIKDFGSIFKTLQKNLKSLSAKASDIEERIKNAELSYRKKRKREVKEWVEEVKSVEREVIKLESEVESRGFTMRLMDGGKASKLNENVEKLIEQSLNFEELVLDVCGNRGEALLTNEMVGQALVQNFQIILELLGRGQVSSIGVYGASGVGKTTLAKHIHNRLVQQSHIGLVVWVTVSRQFTIKSLQDKIARCIGIKLDNEDDEDVRASRLHRALVQHKNSVLILDDVWENIDMLKLGCPVSVNCYYSLIITTRSRQVCRQIRCQKEIEIENLSN